MGSVKMLKESATRLRAIQDRIDYCERLQKRLDAAPDIETWQRIWDGALRRWGKEEQWA